MTKLCPFWDQSLCELPEPLVERQPEGLTGSKSILRLKSQTRIRGSPAKTIIFADSLGTVAWRTKTSVAISGSLTAVELNQKRIHQDMVSEKTLSNVANVSDESELRLLCHLALRMMRLVIVSY